MVPKTQKSFNALPGFSLTLGFTLFYLSAIVLIPFAALVVRTLELSWSDFWHLATNDRALAVSGLLAGGMSRVGAAEKAQLEGLGLRVIDASENGWGIINHDLFLSNAQVRQVIRNVIDGKPAMGA